MQANLEKLEAAHKTSVAQQTELEKQKLKLENETNPDLCQGTSLYGTFLYVSRNHFSMA